MKVEHLAIIFLLIVVPISLVLNEYVQTQIDSIKLQSTYTDSLDTATSDALTAFQLNSVNNKYSSLSDSKIRDIEASVNTFYNSLGTAMEGHVSSREDLKYFIPAILYTLYDGYYIYSSYNNVYSTDKWTDGKDKVVINDQNNINYQDGLRPYIYYSCQYKLQNGETVIVNFTLDNAITLYGDFGSSNGYETKSGYLIDYNKVKDVDVSKKTLKYGDIIIEPETLTEHLLTIEGEEIKPKYGQDYNYIVYNNKKVYQDVDENGNIVYEDTQVPIYDASGKVQYDGYGSIIYTTVRTPKYFWYDNYKKTYLKSEKPEVLKYIEDNGVGFKSISAYEYYIEAAKFSKWAVEGIDETGTKKWSGLGSITQNNIIQNNGDFGEYIINPDGTRSDELYLSVDTDNLTGNNNRYIFDSTKTGNDPLISSSTFNTHRVAVIRKSIETNLATAIANYNKQSSNTYEYMLPVINEDNWYKIANNVSIATFMQGLPMGYKYYNNYSVITSTKNEEVINEQSVYIMAEYDDDKDGKIDYYEYHQPGCKELIDDTNNGNIVSTSLTAYTNLSFVRQTVKLNEVQTRYFYPQSRIEAELGKTTTGCYHCIVDASGDYDIDSIIEGQIVNYQTTQTGQTPQILYDADDIEAVRKAYLTGLARERNDLYKSNFN